jgi:hypothetical protein
MKTLKENLRDASYVKHWFDTVGWEAAAEIERLESLLKWQPIETAPSETVVMCFDPCWYKIPFPMEKNKKGDWVSFSNKDMGTFYPTHWKNIDLPQDT